MMKVSFKNVGRSQASWIANLKDNEPQTIYKHLISRKPRLFRSSFIDVVLNKDGSGRIEAGFHTIGTFTSEQAPASVAQG